jgi:hypothetical protein
VDAVHRGQHRRGDRRGGLRRREAGEDQRPAARLGRTGRERVRPPGPQPDLLEHVGGLVESAAAEPAEQLLRPVADEEAANGSP